MCVPCKYWRNIAKLCTSANYNERITLYYFNSCAKVFDHGIIIFSKMTFIHLIIIEGVKVYDVEEYVIHPSTFAMENNLWHTATFMGAFRCIAYGNMVL